MTMMNTQSANRDSKKRGFTLTEIAIVLGIIGLILGAIWVAAAAVYNNLRVSKATTELIRISQGIRGLYATSAVADSTIDMTYSAAGSHAQGAGSTYIQASIFPSDMVSGTGPYTIANAWTGDTDVVATLTTGGTLGDSFAVEFDKVPQNACITFIEANTGVGRDSGLFAIDTVKTGALAIKAGGTGGTLTFPVPAATAQTLCTLQQNTINVGFQFKLKG
jgi:prepilin-type N-terminal cleavage/methylation domain-containing protein